MQLENRNRFQQACQDQIEIRNLKQGYLIYNEYQFWKIQVNRNMISIKEPNKRQIGKLENQNRFQACQDQIETRNYIHTHICTMYIVVYTYYHIYVVHTHMYL